MSSVIILKRLRKGPRFGVEERVVLYYQCTGDCEHLADDMAGEVFAEKRRDRVGAWVVG
jgi:hypothetical protein